MTGPLDSTLVCTANDMLISDASGRFSDRFQVLTLDVTPQGGTNSMHEILKHMFVLAVPILEKVLRPIFVYIFLIVGLRLSGKRELVQLNPFDLVVLLTLSNTVQNAIIGEVNTVTGGIIGAT